MIRPSAPNIIRMEAFDKVCDVLNMVHHVRHTNWDLRVPTTLWAYRTMCKTLTTQALLMLKYEADAVIHMEHAMPSPRMAAPIDTTVREAQKEGITQPLDTKHMRLEKEIQQGNLRLRELEK